MHLLNDQTIQAICWTLIHSLWQGSLLAIVGGIGIMLTKRSSSLCRYNILAGLFCMFIVTVCFTFAKEYRYDKNPARISKDLSAVNIEQVPLDANANHVITVQKNNLDEFVNYFNEHASAVVLIWFIILSAQLIKFIANAGYVQRIRYYKTHAPSEFWRSRVQDLADSLHIRQKVTLLQSEIVKAPVMVGLLKPVILFPFQLMSQLPSEQIEAVLLHELAHIRRKDYLVNILQNVAEIIFFFNPGVLWISSLIKDERENCCDDIAVAETKNKKEFIHALVCFQEITLANSKYALAFPGKRNHLLNRVKRILTNNNKTLNTMEKISLATGIIVIGLITIAFKHTTKQDTVKKQLIAKTAPAKEVKKDTVPDNAIQTITSTFTYTTTIDGKKYKIHEENHKVKEFYVDGERIPQEKVGQYAEVITKIHKQAADEQEKLQRQNDKLILETQQLQLQKPQTDLQVQEADEENEKMEAQSLENANAKLSQIAQLQMQKDILQRKIDLWGKIELLQITSFDQSLKENREREMRMEKNANAFNSQMSLINEKLLEIQEQSKLNAQKNQTEREALLKKQQAPLLAVKRQIFEEEEIVDKMIAEYDYKKQLVEPVKPVTTASEPVTPKKLAIAAVPVNAAQIVQDAPQVFQSWPITNILDDLANEGIINSRDSVEFNLDGKIFMVNGKQQSEEVHIKFKGKYIKNDKDHVRYSQHGNSIIGDISNGNK